MGYYITKRMSGGAALNYAFCEHTVNTVDFKSTIGNRHTQAATDHLLDWRC